MLCIRIGSCMLRLLSIAVVFAALLRSQTPDVVALSNLGVSLAKQGRFDEAITDYQEALVQDPSNASIRLNLGLAFYKSGRIPEAAEAFEIAYKTAPENTQLILLLADCRLRMGDNRGVIALLEPVEQTDPGNLAIAYLLGTALIRDHQVEEGQRRIDKILRNGESAEAHLLLGNQMFAAGDYPAAVKELERAIQLNPSVPGLQSLYGQALLNTGDADGAAEAFRKELATDPNDFDSNLHLAEILIARKQFAEAATLMQRALRVRPQEAAREDRVVYDLLTGASGPAPGPPTGNKAPALSLKDLASGRTLTLAQISKREPVLLVFGSYTCPNFRAAAGDLNRLYSKYKDQVSFYLVYIREAHSTGNWQSTRNDREGVVLAPAKNMSERAEHATLCVRKLHIDFPALLDDDAGTAAKAYAAWPSRAYLINANGRITYQTGLTELEFKAAALEAAMRNTSARADAKRSSDWVR